MQTTGQVRAAVAAVYTRTHGRVRMVQVQRRPGDGLGDGGAGRAEQVRRRRWRLSRWRRRPGHCGPCGPGWRPAATPPSP